jgi:hypothetical protein
MVPCVGAEPAAAICRVDVVRAVAAGVIAARLHDDPERQSQSFVTHL